MSDIKKMLEEAIAEAAKSAATPEEIAAYNERSVRETRERNLRDSSVPITADDKRALIRDELKDTPALASVTAWVVEASALREKNRSIDKSIFVLMGPVGTGKTVAGAYAISHDGGLYTTMERLAQCRNAQWGDDRDQWLRYERCSLLVIDEFGMESHAAAAQALWDIVEKRRGAGRKLTMILGNLNAKEFRQRIVTRFDVRLLERFKQSGLWREVKGSSLRKAAEGGNFGWLKEPN
jgi:DNA replication protein DnaC